MTQTDDARTYDVQRYRIGSQPFSMSEYDEGEWVEYEDYADLRARLAEVEKERDAAARSASYNAQQYLSAESRADLAPTPQDARVWEHPKVWELIEAVEEGIAAGLLPKTSASEGGAARHSAQVRAADRLRAALAAIQEKENK